MYCISFMFEAIESFLESSKSWFSELVTTSSLEYFQLFFVIATSLWIAYCVFLSLNKLWIELENRGECVGQRRSKGEKKMEAEIRKKNFEMNTFLLELKAMFFTTLFANQLALLSAYSIKGGLDYDLWSWLGSFLGLCGMLLPIVFLVRSPNNKIHRIFRRSICILLAILGFFVYLLA